MIMKTSASSNKLVPLGVIFFFPCLVVFGWAITFIDAKVVTGLVAFLLLIVVAKYPEIGLLYFSIGFDSFSYIADLVNIPEGIRSLVFGAGLALVFSVFIIIRRKDLSCLTDKTLIAAVLLGVVIAASALMRPYSEFVIWKTQAYFLFNLFTMAAAILFSNEPLDQRIMIYTAVFGCLVSNISLFFMVNTPGSIEFGRFMTAYSNPIWLSRTISVLIFANIVVFAAYKNNWLRLCLFVSSVVGIYFMLMTGSRGPLISFVSALVIFFFMSSEISFRKKVFITASLVACFLVLSLLVQDEIKYRYASLVMVEYKSHDYGSTEGRLDGFKEAIEDFFSDPLLGKGMGSYPHNLVLEIAADWGSIGLLIFLYFIITTARVATTLLPKNVFTIEKGEMFKTWAVLCFLCAFLNSLVSGTIATNSLIWFASGCLIAARNTTVE